MLSVLATVLSVLATVLSVLTAPVSYSLFVKKSQNCENVQISKNAWNRRNWLVLSVLATVLSVLTAPVSYSLFVKKTQNCENVQISKNAWNRRNWLVLSVLATVLSVLATVLSVLTAPVSYSLFVKKSIKTVWNHAYFACFVRPFVRPSITDNRLRPFINCSPVCSPVDNHGEYSCFYDTECIFWPWLYTTEYVNYRDVRLLRYY